MAPMPFYPRPNARIAHFIVTLDGKPCVMVRNPAYAPDGVLVAAADGQEPTHFAIDRNRGKAGTVYARRLAVRAIIRTERFIASTTGTTVDEPEFVELVAKSVGIFAVQKVKCPKLPPSQ